ncbi:MAG: M15 family metallopeptidase [Steroidobacteraceae bacterium]
MNCAAATVDLLLTATQLTGREAGHVVASPDWDCLLHPAAAAALMRMRAAALAAGLEVQPISGFRDFDRQRGIWNGKFRGERPLLDRNGAALDAQSLDAAQRIEAILQWSALPGASRHHWGSDLDVVEGGVVAGGYRPQLMPQEYRDGGPFAPLNHWLQEHAADFGFFRPYDRDRGGVQPEPWHLSYAPISVPACSDLRLEVLADALAGGDVDGWSELEPRLAELHWRFVQNVASADGVVASPASRIS